VKVKGGEGVATCPEVVMEGHGGKMGEETSKFRKEAAGRA